MAGWIESLRKASKTSLVQDGKRKIHYTFENGIEMVEEYQLKTHELLARKLKSKTMTGKETKWEYEIGEDYRSRNIEAELIVESIQNPIFMRKDSKDFFQWRIRNLPYPIFVYDISVDEKENLIVIRTSNKKYYKKFGIPDMDRLNLKLDQTSLSFTHANNTLLIKYKKPKEISDLEQGILIELKKMQKNDEGDVEMCTTS